jgi:hypothetical protein
MERKITAFIDGLIPQDYFLFGASFALFILFIILAIVLRKKIALAVFLIVLAFTLLILGPTLGYIKMHDYLYKNSTELLSQQRLEFMDAIVVKGIVKNETKKTFATCKVSAKVHRASDNALKNYIYQFKSIKSASIDTQSIEADQSLDFKIIVEPFRYSKEYNISIGAKCK